MKAKAKTSLNLNGRNFCRTGDIVEIAENNNLHTVYRNSKGMTFNVAYYLTHKYFEVHHE